MDWCCLLGLFAIAAAIVGLPIADAMAAWRMRAIWGSVLDRRAHVGEGAFRSATVETTRPRGVPGSVWVAGVAGGALAPLTGLVLAPVGLVFGLVEVARPGCYLSGFVTLCAGLGGFLLAFALHRASQALLGCEWEAHRIARRVAAWSFAQHAALVVVFAGARLESEHDMAWVAVLASFGVLHAIALVVAGERVRRVQEALTQEALDQARSAILAERARRAV